MTARPSTARTTLADRMPAEPRRLLGLRVSAILETLVFLGTALALGAALDIPDRFGSVSPHPFWMIVLLISTYYGVSDGLMAASFATIAFLAGNLSEQAFGETSSSWLLRETGQPMLWFVAAILFGEIRDGLHRKEEALEHALREARDQAEAITAAYEQLLQRETRLEEHVAAQVQTVSKMYAASQAINRQRVGQVLLGVLHLVRAVLAPSKFSLFLLNDDVLEAALCDGWQSSEPFLRHVPPSSPLFKSIVERQQFLLVADPADEACLIQQGMLAGPLISRDTGDVFGMLKIEEIEFADLDFSTVQNFRIVCEWVGDAFANASTLEQLLNSSLSSEGAGRQAGPSQPGLIR
jgi:polysaccharide biosynthesis protein PelD